MSIETGKMNIVVPYQKDAELIQKIPLNQFIKMLTGINFANLTPVQIFLVGFRLGEKGSLVDADAKTIRGVKVILWNDDINSDSIGSIDLHDKYKDRLKVSQIRKAIKAGHVYDMQKRLALSHNDDDDLEMYFGCNPKLDLTLKNALLTSKIGNRTYKSNEFWFGEASKFIHSVVTYFEK